ncbi:hypothetical protein QOZ80_7BG0612290 [Eleusine coracana subsp. coracana]|nr:hypothetical protein QOZ80_7BG0612290 [Eleusine coracana subsp. coracana]
MTTTTMGILHLIPRPPSHAAPSATLPISRFPCSSRSTTFSPPLPGQKMQTRLRLGSRCAADGAFQLSPEEERDNRILRFREEMDKFDKKYGDGTASRALGVYSRQDTMYDEVGEMAEMVGIRAVMSIRISAMVTANAHLKVDASSEMSFDTVKQIIQTYVSAFVKAAEDACHEKFDRVVIISFIDALGGKH